MALIYIILYWFVLLGLGLGKVLIYYLKVSPEFRVE